MGMEHLVLGCGDQAKTWDHQSFNKVVQALIGISVMTMIDVLFPHDEASDMTVQAIKMACDAYGEAWEDLCSHDGSSDPQRTLQLQILQSRIGKASAFGTEAAVEIRFHRTP